MRQELELRDLARDRGLRVVGVARDLNVSATRVPPWRRKELGHWLHERAPDFDVILVPTGGGGQWTASTLLRRLRNPALMGLRVVEDKDAGARRSRILRDADGRPVRVADPIFTEDEWRALQAALDSRSTSQPRRGPFGATPYLGVLVCGECGTNMTVQRTAAGGRTYAYLRCRSCPSGGPGAPDPDAVYRALRARIVAALGTQPVRRRQYVRGVAGPRQTGPRWDITASGETFGRRWEREGQEAMAADLRRAGVVCRVSRTRIPGTRAPKVELELGLPPRRRGAADRQAGRLPAPGPLTHAAPSSMGRGRRGRRCYLFTTVSGSSFLPVGPTWMSTPS
ncbi:recombinase family protein [Streptomyces zhihengii]